MSDRYKLNHTATKGIQRNRKKSFPKQVFAFSVSLLLAQKVFKHQTSESDPDAKVSTHRKKQVAERQIHICTQAVVRPDLMFYNFHG